jgi:hypothetical protein
MILHLYHGRLTATEELNGWGFSGPIFKSELTKIVVDAEKNITVYAESDKESNIPIAKIPFFKEEGLWEFGGAWYGDVIIANDEHVNRYTDNVIMEHSNGATLMSYFIMTYGTPNQCASTLREEGGGIENAPEGEMVFYALNRVAHSGKKVKYEGSYKLYGAS